MAIVTKQEKITHHIEQLQQIFPKIRNCFPISMYKRLHRLEAEAETAALRYANGYTNEEQWEKKEVSLMKRLDAILGFKKAGVPVFINADPRGYALKIDDSAASGMEIHKDWGGGTESFVRNCELISEE